MAYLARLERVVSRFKSGNTHQSCSTMGDIAQLAEHWFVAPAVAGSNPVISPIGINVPIVQLVKTCDFHSQNAGSNPAGNTMKV